MPLARKLRILLCLTITVIVVPALILTVSAVVVRLDEQAGYLRHSVPIFFLIIYLAAVLIGPIIGFVSLVTLRILRKRDPEQMMAKYLARLRSCILVTSIFAILIDSLWLYCFEVVFFATGFSR